MRRNIIKAIVSMVIASFLCLGNVQASEIELEKDVPEINQQDITIDDEVIKPMPSEISISDVNTVQGTFKISVENVQDFEYIKNMQFAVWSEAKGQDDLIWYNALADEKGNYTKTINIASHNYSQGKYNIHVYITDITGELYHVKSLVQEINIEQGNLLVNPGENNTMYTITLKDVVVPGGISSVQFPVWSKENGQDDIQWYKAEKISDGLYKQNIFLNNHRGVGDYYVHAYVTTKSGELIKVGATTFGVEAPEVGHISVENYNKENGTFRIVVSKLKCEELVQKIQIPVWSQQGGQDDICWYQAKKNDEGQYVVDVNIKNHKYTMGKYIAHVYMTDIAGGFEFQGAVEQEVEIEQGELTVVQVVDNRKQYIIQLKGISIPGGATSIAFPTWSDVNGQDDICWYQAEKLADGTYQLPVTLDNHKGLGKFNVHAYAKMPNGSLVFVGKESFVTETPKIGEIVVSDERKDTGQFQVKITGIENGELIQKIQVPIWSESNQGDIIWYTATKNYEGDYVVNVNISNHKYNVGKYNIHVYMTDITGSMQGVGATSCDMSPEYTDFTAEDREGKESTYHVEVKGLKVPAGVKEVSFAVWGENSGQNDLKWYKAEKLSDGTYSYDVKVRNHKELSNYKVHAYCTTMGNRLAFVGATSFEVKTEPHMAEISVSDIDGTKGNFKVTLTGVFAPSGIEKLQVPIWCADNQSDIVWYDALKTEEGIYTVLVNVANHAHHFGEYKIHAYATMGNGIMTRIGTTETSIQPLNYVYNVSLGSTRREVGIMGVTADRVQFPTWSDTYGQDDIIWYEGSNQGGGKWNAVVDSANHNSGGTYTTHVYATSGGEQKSVGSMSYSLSKMPTEQSMMQNRANLYSSTTPYLILVNRSTHKVGVFQGWQGNWNYVQYWDCSDGKPSTPTVEGTFRVGAKGRYFDSGSARCYWYTQFKGNYLFHSVLYSKYNGSLIDGRLGMPLSHGCVRLHINNAKWIYDTIPTGTTVVVYH